MPHASSPDQIRQIITSWGYVGILVCMFIGNLGFPIPEETVLLTAGFLAGRKILDVRAVFIVVVMSAIASDSGGYLVGRTGGQRMLDWFSEKSLFVQRRRKWFETFFHEHGNKAVFLARFITGLRFIAGPMAGVAGMRFSRFLRWNATAALSWGGLMVGTGYLLGDKFNRIVPPTDYVSQILVLVMVSLLSLSLPALGVILFRRREHDVASNEP